MTGVDRPKAIATGTLAAHGINADCYVLSNGVRVLSQRGIVRALTGKNAEQNGGAEYGGLRRYLARLPSDSAVVTAGPIEFFLPGGGTALGRPAEWFVDLLRAYKTAWRAGLLRSSQVPLAMQADAILDSLAGVGIVALIDEATGYQSVRAHGDLGRLFERMLLANAAKFAKFWADDVIASLARTYRIQYDGRGCPAPMMGVFGWIYPVLLGKDVHEELKRRNPGGPDRDMHHQYFTEEVRAVVRSDQMVIKALSDQSRDKEDFKSRLLGLYRRDGFQLSLIDS